MKREAAMMDWKGSFMKFMKLIGEETNEWYPELWQSYGITEEQAKIILEEYEKYND
jgi:hypothetical protein